MWHYLCGMFIDVLRFDYNFKTLCIFHPHINFIISKWRNSHKYILCKNVNANLKAFWFGYPGRELWPWIDQKKKIVECPQVESCQTIQLSELSNLLNKDFMHKFRPSDDYRKASISLWDAHERWICQNDQFWPFLRPNQFRSFDL